MDALLSALPLVADPSVLLAILVGSLIGLIFGSVPGLTYSLALAVVLPMTFQLPTVAAVGMLLGTYIGGMTGGSVAAILIGIPGTPSAAATVLDGYPLARTGRAGLALGTAVLVSTFGGLFSLAVMIVSVDFVSGIAIKFGPAELFALVLFGLSTICGLAEKSLLRGLIAGVIGLLVMTVGLDAIDGVQRMTFGSTAFLQGVDLLVAMVGLFAVPQIMQTLIDWRRGREIRLEAGDVRSEMPKWSELRRNFGVIVRSAALGTGIGAIPGTGGPIAAFLAYDQARRFSKNKEKFGKGELAGVIAPETANNSVTGGSMIPLLSLGIPGDPATAIILGGLLIHGLTPGPLLFMEHKTEVYTIYLSIVVAYVAILAFQYFGIKLFVRVLRVPPHILSVVIGVLCVIGTFAIRNSFFDVYVMMTIGLLGYLLMRARIPVTPIILGLVLGPTLEREFRTALILSDGSYAIFFQSTAALIFFALTILIIAFHFIGQTRARRAAPNAKASIDAG
ncbi:tripartite tricarboxylate transporter permease [Lutibaculum baratangense]|uniref:Tricarboxylate transport membrane protein TctA n=1 Tax=Lutibaculum baratangense AMV1 TaxID=631454 RepID=V4RMC6_9HYPH|nr:tripartite tricarboxylate transporter permease [Lutibaculum baratangense]ESR27181.1 Tricarboxylate transport membrane protein TctA [Lutibaculum baratangense AMV1]